MSFSLSYASVPLRHSILRWSFVIVALMCAVSAAYGQDAEKGKEKKGTWKGDFSLSAGSNFTLPKSEEVGEHYSKYFSRTSGEGFAMLGYTGKKFSLEGRFDVSTLVYLTGGGGLTAEGVLDNPDKVYGDVSVKETNATSYKGSISGSWTIDAKNLLKFYYQCHIRRDQPSKAVVTADDLLVEYFKYGYTNENLNETTTKNMGGLKYLHTFDKKGREFTASFDMDFQKDDRYTEWNLGDGDMEHSTVEKVYRETPVYYDNSLALNLKYTDRNFLNVRNLDLEFLCDCGLKADLDRLSAATLINGAWVDSTSYREDFDFFSLLPKPGVRVAYTKGIFNVDARYQPEFYLYNLSDGNNIDDRNLWGATAHLVNFQASVSPGKYHRIAFNFKRDMRRPDYIQLCWFDRAGAYANEITRGNPDLKPASNTRISLVYDFKYRRFSAAFDIGSKYEFDKIESTFYNEEREDGTYRINTWINSSKSMTANAAVLLKWNGRNLKAEAGFNFNYYVGIKESGTETRNSDYSVKGAISYLLKTWEFKANLKYQSAIIRNYTSTTDILGCDVRIYKSFKHFGVFLEGRDLFDKAIEKWTISDDESQHRVELTNDNKRIFLLGVRYTF